MKPQSSYNAHITGVIKDSLIIALLFISLCFIDVGVAAYISVITTAILLTRRIILDLNPGVIKGYQIRNSEKELIVPKGVDVFDLSNVPSMEYLYTYIEVIRGILVPPAVIIIRFCGIAHIKEYELDTLKKVLRRLKKSKITVILSDVNENVRNQFGHCEIESEVGIENIFYNISDALLKTKRMKKEKSHSQ